MFKNLSIIAAILSAVLWFWSAKVAIPELGPIKVSQDGRQPAHVEFEVALRKQSRLNALAALFTGLAVVFQIIGV